MQGFADKLNMSLWVTNSKSREPNLQDHSHMRRGENNKQQVRYIYDFKGLWIKGMEMQL